MTHFEKEDVEELIRLLEKVSQSAAFLTDESDRQEKLEAVRQGLQSFHTTAAMLGMEASEQSGLALLEFFTNKIAVNESGDPNLVFPFVSTIKAIAGEMKGALNGNGGMTFEVEPLIEILYAIPGSIPQDEVAGELTADEFPAELSSSDLESQEPAGEVAPEAACEPVGATSRETEPVDLSDLKRITESLGGKFQMESENGNPSSFQLTFPTSPQAINKVLTLLATSDLKTTFSARLNQQDSERDRRVEKVLHVFEEFVDAFSSGDLKRAQEILLSMAEQQQQAGLYKQVGVMARQLHDSLKGFTESLDPTLVEIVEDKIPDSGSRLEHILRLTENAANTTLDHVELMQKRNQEQQTRLTELQETLCGMKALGDKAQQLLGDSQRSLGELHDSLNQTSEDLITILTAQDYQDLTGQIIQKIIVLLKNLESNLVGVIRTFGVRLDGRRETVREEEELYGPAHEGRTSAMHSQDDVDSLLAEFGF